MNSHENFNICLLQNRCKRIECRAAKTVRFVYFSLFIEKMSIKMGILNQKWLESWEFIPLKSPFLVKINVFTEKYKIFDPKQPISDSKWYFLAEMTYFQSKMTNFGPHHLVSTWNNRFSGLIYG